MENVAPDACRQTEVESEKRAHRSPESSEMMRVIEGAAAADDAMMRGNGRRDF